MTGPVRLMPSRGTGYRPPLAFDGAGGWYVEASEDVYLEAYSDEYPGWPITAEDVPCKYDPGSTADPVVADQQRGELFGRLFVLLEVDIERGDLWVLDDGRRLKVEHVTRPGGRGISAGGQKVAAVLELQPDTTAP